MEKIKNFFKTKWKFIVIAVVALLLIAVLAAVLFVNGLLGNITYDDPYRKSSQSGDIINDSSVNVNSVDAKDFADEQIHTVDGDSTKDSIKKWCESGTVASSKDVINILLMGMDNRNIKYNSRADSMMIASINTKTGQITLASILRDQYAYVNSRSIKFEKMHHALVRGGPAKQIEVIEAHYKVQIDNYILVNFTSFKSIIDKLGGVTINLTSAEAKVLGMSAGEQLLNGTKALEYSRIRYIDTDVARTGRQQKVIEAIIQKARGASLVELTQVISELLQYVRTGMSKSEILGYATEAFTSGWFSYDIVHYCAPGENYRKGGFKGDIWYWTVNYPRAAQELQMTLYGRTNIVIDE
ncbi:MAG: LCP family protein [Firmicutes bacterium]|nr:LCP family protein [Bacillota bacterium]